MIDLSQYKVRGEKGDEDAIVIVGLLAALHVAEQEDIRKADVSLRSAAEAGSHFAQYVLARITEPLFRPMTEPPYLSVDHASLERAIKMYLIPSEAGFSPAQRKLAFFYEVLGDIDQAIFWYGKAVENGSADAALELARIHDSQSGSRPDPRRSAAYLTRAAELGNTSALAIEGEKLMLSDESTERSRGWEKLRQAVIAGDPTAYRRFAGAILRGLIDLTDRKNLARIFTDMAKARSRNSG